MNFSVKPETNEQAFCLEVWRRGGVPRIKSKRHRQIGRIHELFPQVIHEYRQKHPTHTIGYVGNEIAFRRLERIIPNIHRIGERGEAPDVLFVDDAGWSVAYHHNTLILLALLDLPIVSIEFNAPPEVDSTRPNPFLATETYEDWVNVRAAAMGLEALLGYDVARHVTGFI